MMKHVGAIKERKILDSSSVFFYRERKSSDSSKSALEILLGKRKENLKAFPGLWSGVGGKVSKKDSSFLQEHSDNKNINLLKICAIREVIEELGLVILTNGIKQIPPAKRIELEELDYGVEDYDWERLIPAGLKQTPEFTIVNPIFKTQYFLCKVPETMVIENTTDNEEFSAIAWKSPEEWIDGFENQELRIPPPVLGLLRFFIPNKTVQEAATLSEANNTKPIGLQTRVEIHPGIFIIPLKSQTILPATTTNCLLIGDQEHRYLVDPGSHLETEQERILQVVNEITGKNGLKGILLTHHHKDHWESVAALQRKLEVPVITHDITKELLQDKQIDFTINRTIKNGDMLDLGIDTKGRDWRLEVLYTGGHSKDHVTFLDRRFNALLAGDMIAGIGTVLVEDMGQYLRSLDQLLARNIGVLIPGHGGIQYDGQKLLQQYKSHRLGRLNLILDAFSKYENYATIDELTEVAYSDVDKEYHNVAKIQVQTYLRYLEEKKEVLKDGNKFRKVA